ncbi:ankyrin repeat domain-containing protein 26 isoform X2 [Dunckerocampus dactyliophorus]|uniref:ankyrin repeat domain-containing protein 26 isoform X2 n=1 Tax=Dunckerocampus dactyliophorus TaxID=161453 RepID=UPI0024075129|nr:ankyrin repeat domain-containing protein 26 isoform X2 [Dunckerocampus dactyliophorus]
MKKLFSFSKRKQSPSGTPNRANVVSVGYEVKEKDLGKFHKAAWKGDVSKLEHLVKSNDVNQADKQNRTALHIACASGNSEVVKLLVEKKAKLNLCDNESRTALMKAVQGQHDVIVNILLENNADANLMDVNGNTALHLASIIPSISIVDLLVKHDADINVYNKEGLSPLTVSVQEDHLEVAEFLLKNGADVNILDKDHRSPLMIAAGNGQISMVRMLLQFDADSMLKDNKGQSAEDYAAIESHHPCALLIAEHGTKRNQAASLSHPGPSKKRAKSEMGNPSRGLNTDLSVGGPALDKDDFEDNSQAESLSRLSKKGGTDEWASSEEDCESLIEEKTPPKMNLRKMLESKRGKAERLSSKGHPLAQLSGSQSSSESDAQSSEDEGSDEEDDDDDEDDEEEDYEESSDEESEEIEEEEDSCLASVQSNSSSVEDAQKLSLLNMSADSRKAQNIHNCNPVNSASPHLGVDEPQENSGVDQDCVVSAVRVDSRYSDEDDSIGRETVQSREIIQTVLDAIPASSQRNVVPEGERTSDDGGEDDRSNKEEKRRSSWGSSLEDSDIDGSARELAQESSHSNKGSNSPQKNNTKEQKPPEATPKCKSKLATDVEDSNWDSPSESDDSRAAGGSAKATPGEQFVGGTPILHESSEYEDDNNTGNQRSKDKQGSKNSCADKGNDCVDLLRTPRSLKVQSSSDKMAVQVSLSRLPKTAIEADEKFIADGGDTYLPNGVSTVREEENPPINVDVAVGRRHSYESLFSEALPHTDIDDVDLDSPDEVESLMHPEDRHIEGVAVQKKEPSDADSDDSDNEEEEEEQEQEPQEDILGDQSEGSGDLLHVTPGVPERDVPKDMKRDLGLEKKEEDSWDSEHEDKDIVQVENQEMSGDTGEKLEEDLLYIPSFLRGGKWMPEPWWSRGGLKDSLREEGLPSALVKNKHSNDAEGVQKEDGTQKESEETKWGLLLSKCEGKSKDKIDLMDELGLGEFDYAEDASDWDTSSNASKRSLPGCTKTSPTPKVPECSSKEKAVSPQVPIATPRKIGTSPHPQPRTNKIEPEESDKSDWDQDSSSSSCNEAKTDNHQSQVAVRPGSPELSAMASGDKEQQHKQDKDDALESCNPCTTGHMGSDGGNDSNDQQSPEERPNDAVLPKAKCEDLWEEVEKMETKPTFCNIAGDLKEVISAEEESSDEEEGEVILRPRARARRLVLLSVPEQKESVSEDSDNSLSENIPDFQLPEEPEEEPISSELPQALTAKKSSIATFNDTKHGPCQNVQTEEPENSHTSSDKNLKELSKSQPLRPSRLSASLPIVSDEEDEDCPETQEGKLQKELVKETAKAAVSMKTISEYSDTDGRASEELANEKPEIRSVSCKEMSRQAEASQQAQPPTTSESSRALVESQLSRQRNSHISKAEAQAGGKPTAVSKTRRTPQTDARELSVFDDSTLSDVSEDEGRGRTGEEKKKQKHKEIEISEDLDELNSSSDMTTDDSDFATPGHGCGSLFIQNLDSVTTDSRSMVKLQNIFHKYERSIQKAKSRHAYFADKVSLLESEKAQLRSSLDEIKDVKALLERNRLELQAEVTNLKFQLRQEQENGHNATMMYNTTGDKLRRTEEQRQVEVQEKQKVELTLRNLELEMRILLNSKKQLEEDHSQTQTLLAQERSARTVLENLLNNHVRKQQEIEEENKRNISKSNEALSQLTEASDRERELLQQISIFQEQLSKLRTDLESSQASSSIKQRDLQEENKALKEQLDEARRALKVNSDALNQSVLDFNNQTATLKSELTVTATRLENERQSRETMAVELESVRTRLTVALQEAERCMGARSDTEKALLWEKEEHHRLKERLSSDASSQNEAISSLSQKLAKAEAHANSMENQAHQATLQLTEKNLLLNTMQRENDQIAARVKDLEATLHAEKELVTRAGARQEATQERLAQAQSEGMLLRQQLEEAQNKGVAKENAVTDAQKSFTDILSKLRSDCEERIQLVQDRNQDLAAKAVELRERIHQLEEEKNDTEAKQRQLQQDLADSLKKLSMCEASLEINTRYRNDLEEEKTRLLKDKDNLQGKLEEREVQCLQAEKHTNELKALLIERDKEFCAAVQKQQEALSAAAASDITVKQLEEAVQRLEIENVRLEAAAKQQSNKLEALQKCSEEAAKLSDSPNGGMVRAHLEDLVTNLQSSKMTLEDQLSKEVQKQSLLSNSAQDSQAMWEEELKSRSKLGLRLTELEKEKGELTSQMEIEKKKAKKAVEQKKAVDSRLEQEMERNTALQKEIYRLRTVLKTAKKKLRDQDRGAGADFSSPMSSLRMELGRHSQTDGGFEGRKEKVNDLHGELERGGYQGGQLDRRLLEEEVQNLKRRVESSQVEQRQMEQYRIEIEEKARQEIRHKLQEVNLFLQSQAATQEAQDQIKATNEASLRLKIQELESELTRTRNVQHDTLNQRESTRSELERYKELYREEQKLRKSLSADLKRTNHQLTEASSRLVNEHSRSLIASTGPPGCVGSLTSAASILGSPYMGYNSRLLSPSVAEGQGSSVEDYLAMMQRQLDRSISRELNKASAELDISLARMSPVGSASRMELDPVSRAKQQYLEVLKKNHEV